MSQTVTPPPADTFLLSQRCPQPQQPLDIETYASGKSIRMITAISRFSFCHLDKPAPKAQNSKPVFGVNQLFGPDACTDYWTALIKLADTHWKQAGHTFHMGDDGVLKLRNPVTGQLLVTPIKSGDFYYAKKPASNGAYKGLWYINPSSAADKPPVYLDARGTPCAASIFYSGCYGRSFIEIATIADKQGYEKGITSYLKSVQFVRHGDKFQEFDVLAASTSAFAAAPLPAEMVQQAGPPAGPPGAWQPPAAQPGPAAYPPPGAMQPQGYPPPGAMQPQGYPPPGAMQPQGYPAGVAPPGAVPPQGGFAAPPSGAAPWGMPPQQPR